MALIWFLLCLNKFSFFFRKPLTIETETETMSDPEKAIAKIEQDFTKSSIDTVKVAENKNYEVDQEIETSVSVSEVI